MRLVIVTVGIDEKLPLRGLLKVGLSVNDTVLLVYSRSGGETEVKVVEKSVEALKNMIARAGAKAVELAVSGAELFMDTAVMLKLLKAVGVDNIDEAVGVAAGGSKLLAFELLLFLTMVRRFVKKRSKMCVVGEDGYDVVVPLDVLYVTLSGREDAVLKKLSQGGARRRQVVDEVSREYGVSESLVYKMLKSLSRKGLVAVEDDVVKLTELGRLVYEATRGG